MKSWAVLLFSAVACLPARGADEPGLFTKSMESYRVKSKDFAWGSRVNAIKSYCLEQATAVANAANQREFLRIGINRAIEVSGAAGLASYKRNWELVYLLRYAMQEKRMKVTHLAGFLGAACMFGGGAMLNTPSTLSFYEFPGKRMVLFSNVDPNWLRVYLDTTSPTCDAPSKIWSTGAAPGNVLMQHIYGLQEFQIDNEEAESSLNCYLSQFLESPINASVFLMNGLFLKH